MTLCQRPHADSFQNGECACYKDRFGYEEMGKRKLMIHMVVLLSNLRACKVAISQICNVYQPHLDQDLLTLLNLD